jgi:hypothetical protein
MDWCSRMPKSALVRLDPWPLASLIASGPHSNAQAKTTQFPRPTQSVVRLPSSIPVLPLRPPLPQETHIPL